MRIRWFDFTSKRPESKPFNVSYASRSPTGLDRWWKIYEKQANILRGEKEIDRKREKCSDLTCTSKVKGPKSKPFNLSYASRSPNRYRFEPKVEIPEKHENII